MGHFTVGLLQYENCAPWRFFCKPHQDDFRNLVSRKWPSVS